MTKLIILLTGIMLFGSSLVIADDVPTISKDELKARMDKVVILDVRTDSDWSSSDSKIKGAIRVNDGDLTLVKDYPKTTVLVLYCA
jgi:rhodanese-related sulfurtransferase